MKRLIVCLIAVVLLTIVGILAYWGLARTTFVRRTMRDYTQITDMTVLHKMQDDHERYGDARISEAEGRAFFDKHQWKQGFKRDEALAGTRSCSTIVGKFSAR